MLSLSVLQPVFVCHASSRLVNERQSLFFQRPAQLQPQFPLPAIEFALTFSDHQLRLAQAHQGLCLLIDDRSSAEIFRESLDSTFVVASARIRSRSARKPSRSSPSRATSAASNS